jgi:hypothetical protein
MKEKIHPIFAGSRSVYEIVENSDPARTLTIRVTQHPEQCITIMRTMVPALIEILKPLGYRRVNEL